MDGLKQRLKSLREEEGLSLRAFAERVGSDAGFSVTHDSVRRYESGERRVPSEYVGAVCQAFGVSSQWLLFGRGARSGSDGASLEAALNDLQRAIRELRGGGTEASGEMRRRLRREWGRFLEGHRDHRLIRLLIVESWDRSLEAGVQARDDSETFRRLTTRERAAKIADAAPLLDAARPHLRWVSGLCADVEHAVCVTDSDGIVLESMGSSQRAIDRWGVVPGTDCSEGAMGTSGAGTAIEIGRPVAILGPEHFQEAFHDAACIAAPVGNSSGAVVGAIALNTTLASADPFRLVAITYAAEEIERDLAERAGDPLTALGTE